MNAGPNALTHALCILIVALLAGCTAGPQTARLDGGLSEQIFSPKFVVNDDSTLNCQWIEFHRDSVGGAGVNWNPARGRFDTVLSYDFIQRRYVQCIPELMRWTDRRHSTATFVAHSCIQESFMVFRDSTGKREAAWLAAPAIQTYPLKVDSVYLIVHGSSTEYGLITIWLDNSGRELSRDTLDLPVPDFAAAAGDGATLVKREDDAFHIYHLGRACSWIDSGTVNRGFSGKQSFGTDYFVQDGEIYIVSGYNLGKDDAMFETHVVNGTRLLSTHQAKLRPFSGLNVVACRAIDAGEEFPCLVALSESVEGMSVVVLAQDSEGYWSKRGNAESPVSETIQEFCAVKWGNTVHVACTVAADTSAVANSVEWIGFNL